MTCILTDWRRNHDGYGYRSNRMAHRVAWEKAHGPIPPGLFVLHHCDVPACIRTEPDGQWPDGHLFLGTHADNMADMKAKGRQRSGDNSGEANGRAKLTAADLPVIRERLSKGETKTAVASAFGVSRSAIGFIARGQHWVPQ